MAKGRWNRVQKYGEWKEFIPHVTNVAILPVFAAGCLTPPRRTVDVLEELGIPWNTAPRTDTARAAATTTTRTATTTKPMTKQYKVPRRMPGRSVETCMLVAYCSKECQAKDCLEYKKVCGVKTEARIH